MTKQPPYVTNHAILRYLERAQGVDVAAVRRRLSELAETAISGGALTIAADDVKIVLKGSTVVTVLPKWAKTYEQREGVND